MAEAISLHQIYEELRRIERNMITKDEMSRLLNTLEILQDSDMMEQIRESEQNIKQGKIKKFEY